MHRLLSLLAIATISTIALGQMASAADLVSKVRVYEPPVYSWAGFYAGANLGWTRNKGQSVSYSQANGILGDPPFPDGVFGGNFDLSSSSLIGGGQMGYNFQWRNFVLGIEGDISTRNLHSETTLVFNTFGDSFTLSQRSERLATIRGRVGYAFNNWLIYGTGGWAIGRSTLEVFQGSTDLAASRRGADNGAKSGWAAGGGFEYMFASSWSLGVEYLFVDLGTRNVNLPKTDDLIFPVTRASFDDRSNIVRGRLNYRFW
jgi:outer membrane immunogenic protein